MARPTNVQVRERQDRDKLRARYELQESRRAPQIQIDTTFTQRLLLVLAGITFLGTVVLVANGTYSVAQFIGLPLEALGWLVFAGIEVTVLWSLVSYLTLESRGEDSRAWYAVMLLYSGITIVTNCFHTLEFWAFDWYEPRMWAGVVLSTAIPLSFVLVSKALSRVVFAKAVVLT